MSLPRLCKYLCVVAIAYFAAAVFAQGAKRSDEAFFISFQVPGEPYTQPTSINAFMTVTGSYIDANDQLHGFVRDVFGRLIKFDPPGSGATGPASINRAGAITGGYFDSSGVAH